MPFLSMSFCQLSRPSYAQSRVKAGGLCAEPRRGVELSRSLWRAIGWASGSHLMQRTGAGFYATTPKDRYQQPYSN
jgi:hypothetical protein